MCALVGCLVCSSEFLCLDFVNTVNCTASLKCRKLVWFLVLISWVVPSCILCHMKVYESAHKAILAAYTDTHFAFSSNNVS